MSNSCKIKVGKMQIDHSDISYVLELLTNALRDEDWDSVSEAKEFLQEYLDDDGGPIELEE